MGKCRFNSKWLEQRDAAGHLVSTWARKINDENILCAACDKTIQLQRGIQAIMQHSRGEKHKEQFQIKFKHRQLHLEARTQTENIDKVDSGVAATSHSLQLELFSPRENAIKAELIWTMRATGHNYSFLSCEGIVETFKSMFPDSKCLTEFALSPTKMRYLITEALGPFFIEKLTEDIEGKFFFAIFLYYVPIIMIFQEHIIPYALMKPLIKQEKKSFNHKYDIGRNLIIVLLPDTSRLRLWDMLQERTYMQK